MTTPDDWSRKGVNRPPQRPDAADETAVAANLDDDWSRKGTTSPIEPAPPVAEAAE